MATEITFSLMLITNEYWKLKVAMVATFSSLAKPEAVMTISSATIDDKADIIATVSFSESGFMLFISGYIYSYYTRAIWTQNYL